MVARVTCRCPLYLFDLIVVVFVKVRERWVMRVESKPVAVGANAEARERPTGRLLVRARV